MLSPIQHDPAYSRYVASEEMNQAHNDLQVLKLAAKLKSEEQVVALVTDLFNQHADEPNQQAIRTFTGQILQDSESGMYGFYHKKENFLEYWPGEHPMLAFCTGFFNSLYNTDPDEIKEVFGMEDIEPSLVEAGPGNTVILNVSEIKKMYEGE